MEGERVACGSAHADNVAPAILGGFVLIRSYNPLEVIQLPTPSVWAAVVTPLIELKTADARRILRRSIELSQAVAQWGNVAGLIAGIFSDNHPLIGRSLEDHIIEPERSQLIPGFREVKEAALASGALGCSISGAGPSIFTLTSDEATANSAALAMQRQFASLGIDSTCALSPINSVGATIISKS
jgi:homoserine kinase